MEIKIQIKNRVFSLCIGNRTNWFCQSAFITFTEEEYENMEVVWAYLIWQSPFKRIRRIKK